jgi:hypothetical protein
LGENVQAYHHRARSQRKNLAIRCNPVEIPRREKRIFASFAD